MDLYNTQPTPPAGAYQIDLGALTTSLDRVTRSGGVVGPAGRGHGNLNPGAARELAQRGTDISVLATRTQPTQGLEL